MKRIKTIEEAFSNKRETLEEMEKGMSKEELEYLNGIFDIFIESIDWGTVYD
jgi:hypothetical protein